MIRNPMHAGTFYPRFADQIRKQIEQWLLDAVSPVNKERNLGLILPHAGYMYSGKCAAWGLNSISNEVVDTFIILHPSHQGIHFDYSLSPYTEYLNPMGSLKLDTELYNKLSPAADQEISLSYHQNEHSMEIQLPLISYFFPHAKILPIMIGNQIPQVAQRLAEQLYDLIFKSTSRIILLCSTDLSHYHSSSKAESLDGVLLETVKALDPEALWQAAINDRCEACGIGGILTLLYFARHFSNAALRVVQYTHSGKVSGNNSQVVGYLAAKLFV